MAVGDLNGDGFADLAIGALKQDVGAVQDAGGVNVINGSLAGLSATTVPSRFWSPDSPNLLDQAEDGDTFGHSLAAGDFNCERFTDLAIGAHW